jgi:hypothetical protein
MKKIISTICIGLFSLTAHAGMDHSRHGGSGQKPNPNNMCQKANIGKHFPPELTEVEPGAKFSFRVADAQSPKQIEVTVKNIPVPITTETKDNLVMVQGQLPATLKNMTVRVLVKVKHKMAKCAIEEGWLLKVKE